MRNVYISPQRTRCVVRLTCKYIAFITEGEAIRRVPYHQRRQLGSYSELDVQKVSESHPGSAIDTEVCLIGIVRGSQASREAAGGGMIVQAFRSRIEGNMVCGEPLRPDVSSLSSRREKCVEFGVDATC